jgi:hypothetical protein
VSSYAKASEDLMAEYFLDAPHPDRHHSVAGDLESRGGDAAVLWGYS